MRSGTDTGRMQRDERKLALVTGGAGFIGSHLCDRLLAMGWRVRALDDLSVGRASNVAQHADNPAFSLHVLDVADGAALAPLLDGCTRVFHLAALADIVPSIEAPLRYAHANVTGTMTVLEAARAAGVQRFVYAASSSCYGIPDVYPTPEQAPCRPQYPYALTKYLGEQAVLHWGQIYDLPVVSLRFFNVYGPRARTSGTYGAMFGVFLAQRLAGKPYTVVGDGTQSRDFTYVGDVVEALVRAADSDVRGEVINVGTGKPVSVNEIVRILGGPVVHVPKRPGEPDCTCADTRRAQALLGFVAQVGIEQGIAQLLAHIDDWKDAPVWTPERIADATAAWFRHLGRNDDVAA